MAHITKSVPEVYTVNDHELRAYLQAGYRLASAEEYHHWARTQGRGQARAPRAPELKESKESAGESAEKAERTHSEGSTRAEHRARTSKAR